MSPQIKRKKKEGTIDFQWGKENYITRADESHGACKDHRLRFEKGKV